MILWTWLPTTEEHYFEMLGVLPPASMGADGSFQVGEAMDHRDGQPTFSSFKVEGGQYFESSEALTFAEFRRECPGAIYCY